MSSELQAACDAMPKAHLTYIVTPYGKPRSKYGVGTFGKSPASRGTPTAILGRIKATDADSAVREWIEKFDITDPEQQKRLVARPVK